MKPRVKLNVVDRVVGYFSPSALVKRKRARAYNEIFARKYEGADAGRRTGGWYTTNGSANAEIAGSKIRLRNRARDLVRNNPYAARALEVITNNVVGRGIKTQIKVDDSPAQSAKERRLNRVWRAWSETTACDYEGRLTLYGMQRLVMRAVAESGDVLIRLRRTERQRNVIGPDGRPVEVPPIKLQVLEGDFIAINQVNRELTNGNTIIEGVEINPQGQVVAYHVYKTHPGNINVNIKSDYEVIRIDAEDVLLMYRADRPGQLTGTPWLAPVLLKLRDFDLYEDAQLKRQQCASMYTAFVYDTEGLDEFEETEVEAELGEKMEPGLIEILPPGKDIKLANPPGAENYEEYTSAVLRSIASGMGITYEALTGNLKDTNFSAGRMGHLEMQRNIDTWQSGIMLDQFMRPVFSWFLEALGLIGVNAQNARAIFTPPRREMIDPAKEVQASLIAVRSGFKTLSEVVKELGRDPDTHFQEYLDDMTQLDELGLVFDSDPRKRDKSGKVNSEQEGEPESEDSNENDE